MEAVPRGTYCRRTLELARDRTSRGEAERLSGGRRREGVTVQGRRGFAVLGDTGGWAPGPGAWGACRSRAQRHVTRIASPKNGRARPDGYAFRGTEALAPSGEGCSYLRLG
ncbi:hypothetical protein SKAU_G00291460 [Synaphobranchus kaupii]|uniref:Uncharacterized protein n=1 Tax=Synaphobranchus kaupii TaxID=118154 RepID=A0A9Q1IMB7_SYNKA|nr:hypothetical protein SKAU_G00291460 [Synaphobranchus kaupii]